MREEGRACLLVWTILLLVFIVLTHNPFCSNALSPHAPGPVQARIRFDPPRVPDQEPEDDLETDDDDEETEVEEIEEVEEDGNVRHVLSARNVRNDRSDDRGLGPINVLGLRRRIRREAAARRAAAAGHPPHAYLYGSSVHNPPLVLPPPPGVQVLPELRIQAEEERRERERLRLAASVAATSTTVSIGRIEPPRTGGPGTVLAMSSPPTMVSPSPSPPPLFTFAAPARTNASGGGGGSGITGGALVTPRGDGGDILAHEDEAALRSEAAKALLLL